ncbi:sensor histidine kinase [Mongoliimonas terrestris]|uniref:sensor histidine kinase n=1 Tax=Mongoliimonas terrestris TaxID=1709001 RepID=UPI000AFCECC9|nr:PAS domain S-box protein [Mongoliimonas terrestris]
MSAREETGPGGGRRWTDVALSAMPVAAIVLLVALVGLLLMVTAADERETARTTLISDALWVEQTLRFQLSTDEDTIARLALDAGSPAVDAAALSDRARLFVVNNPEVIAIALMGADGTPRFALPALAADAVPPAIARAKALARFSARPVYGDMRRMADGTLVVDLAAAVPGPDGPGALVATVSLTALMTRHVPWWIGEKYAVRLVDSGGAVLAEKARVEPLHATLVHQIAFDPPIRGTALAIAPYRPTGTGGPTLLTAAIVALAAFAVVSLVALQRHVARRRRVESQLRDETAFRRAMEDSLTIGMRARDLDGRIIYVNPAFCRMVGFAEAELIGAAPPMPYWLPDEIEETRARHDAQIKGEKKAKSWETRFRRADGRIVDALLYEAPLIDADGVTRGWMGSIIDVTDTKAAADLARRQAESLQRTGRLITLGEMASTLAHELNQPLAAIASYAAGSLNMLRSGRFETAEVAGALEKLSVQADRAGRIIRRIQDFVRKREPRFGAVLVADVVEDSVAFSANDLAAAGVRLEVDVGPDLPPVTADRILLEQVLLNLVRNGAEAMAGLSDRVLTVTARRQGAEVAITVADRGCGIDGAVAGRLFDAFVSTKPEGMGMGLNICRSIVELHKGRLAHAPRPGGGTVFTVTLPAAVDAGGAGPAGAAAAVPVPAAAGAGQ